MDKDKIKEFSDYFKDDLKELEEEFKKSSAYSAKIDTEIERFSEIFASKGGQHYMIEHMRNAIQLQSQRQSILKDKVAIRKLILDYTMRSKEEENSGKSTFDLLNELLKKDNKVVTIVEEKHIDRKIDEVLDNLPEKEDE